MNLKDFLEKNLKETNGFFSLVTYNNETKAIWFSKSIKNDSVELLAAPCKAIKSIRIYGNEDLFCKEFMSNNLILPNELNKEEYIDNHIKAFIKDGWLYDIDTKHTQEFLPDNVDNIKTISRKECLSFLLERQNTK